jgi:hypothetical protein
MRDLANGWFKKMSKGRKILIACLVATTLAVGAPTLMYNYEGVVYSRATAAHDLQAAKTTSEENAAFDRMWCHSRVAFSLCDGAGNELDMHAAPWPPKGTAVVRFKQFDSPLDHRLIDLENLWTLVRE